MHEKACVDFKGKYRQQKKDINVRMLTNHELNYNKIRSLKTSHKYLTRSKDIGIGTLISIMLPYSIFFLITWSIFLIVWMILGIPLGPKIGRASCRERV